MTEHKTKDYPWKCYDEKDGQLVIDNLNGIALEVLYCPFCGRKSKKTKKIKQLKTYRY